MPTVQAETKLSDLGILPLPRYFLEELERLEVYTLEDVYEMILSRGPDWYQSFYTLSKADAVQILQWLEHYETVIGEIPQEYKSLTTPTTEPVVYTPVQNCETSPLMKLPAELSGEKGLNRGQGPSSITSTNDWEAINAWLKARAVNANTLSQYRKESTRFLLWCTMERGKALSSISTEDASLYPLWLEDLGRLDAKLWATRWKLPQTQWIGARNAPYMEANWFPYNGPLSSSSRKTALTVVRLLFNFLTKTRYIELNPFDSVTSKVRLLPGEGAPKAFADRSLSETQWKSVTTYLSTLDNSPSNARLRLILALGKGLGMRASEIIAATAGWIQVRRIGDDDLTVIEIVGKGDKIRRLPLSDEMIETILNYFSLRGINSFLDCPKDTPLIVRKTRGNQSVNEPLSRSGLHRILKAFLDDVAVFVEQKSLSDANKLRASSAHWLRHTFATTALKAMDINIVQNAMGHASIGTTSRYLTPEEAAVARAMKKMKSF